MLTNPNEPALIIYLLLFIIKTCVRFVCLFVCLFTGSGLKCNRCISKGCKNTIETCGYKLDACIAARYTSYPCTYLSVSMHVAQMVTDTQTQTVTANYAHNITHNQKCLYRESKS